MKPEEVKLHVGNRPYMRLKEARFFYDLMTAHRLTSVLELGFFHGVSTSYLAGTVHEMGGGSITTIDLVSAKDREPNVESLLTACGLRDLVEIFYEPKTFNWRLMKFLEEEPPRSFDLCYIDGGHTWVDTGFAYCLVRQLLRPGGWVVFDDIPHTYNNSSNQNQTWIRRMTEEEKVTPQVERVFKLLAMRDKEFDTFRIVNTYGIARKRTSVIPATADELYIEAQICTAAHRARTNPAFRQHLMHEPARVLAQQSGKNETLFRHIRFAESGLWSPLEPDLAENGILTHYLERPEWDKTISEASLVALMEG